MQDAPQAVLGSAAAARPEVDLELADTRAKLRGDRGDKPVHFTVQAQLARQVAAVGLQRATVIVQVDAG